MSLAHRHIFKAVALSSFGGVLVFAFIILLATVFKDMLGMWMEGRLSIEVVVRLSLMTVPYVLIHALPMGLLTGVLFALGRLSADNEIMAFRASGMSIARLSSSVVVLSLMAVMAALAVNLVYGPMARASYRRELSDAVSNNPLGFIVPRTFVRDFPGYIIYVGEKEGEVMRDIWVWRLDENSRALRQIRAVSGNFDFEVEARRLDLRLLDGFFEDRDKKDPENFRTSSGTYMSFRETRLPLSLDKILGPTNFKRKLYWMPFAELMVTRRDLEARLGEGPEVGAQLQEVKMTLQEKMATAFASFSLVMVAIPLGIVTRRREGSANLFLAMGLAFLYYLSMMFVGWMGELAWLHPDLWYWMPNLGFQALGLSMIIRMDRARHRSPSVIA